MRQRCPGCGVSPIRNWVLRRRLGVWTDRTDDGVCDRTYFGLSSQSSSFPWPRAGRRFPTAELLPYVIAQVLGGMLGAGVLYLIASGKAGFDVSGGFASNGYAAHSPGGYSLFSCFIAEVVLTCFFLIIIMGATDRRAPSGFAPVAIGLGLTLIHLIGIPVTNLSVNPARSTGPAIFVGGWALAQLWLFWVAPIIGGTVGGALYAGIFEPGTATTRTEAASKTKAAIA